DFHVLDPVRIISRTLNSSFQEPLKNRTPAGSPNVLLPSDRQRNPAHPPPELKTHQVLFSNSGFLSAQSYPLQCDNH
ncbi:hypothetical protein GOODEAATRI_022844, partial [Goodea atripinnis]